jgi:hypothetical protein
MMFRSTRAGRPCHHTDVELCRSSGPSMGFLHVFNPRPDGRGYFLPARRAWELEVGVIEPYPRGCG